MIMGAGDKGYKERKDSISLKLQKYRVSKNLRVALDRKRGRWLVVPGHTGAVKAKYH